MATYPTLSIQPEEPLVKTWRDTTLFTDTEADYIRTRARTSRFTNAWNLVYNRLSATDYALLEAFFEARRGYAESFTWVHPITAVSYTVRFLKDTFNANLLAIGRWRVSFTLEEV